MNALLLTFFILLIKTLNSSIGIGYSTGLQKNPLSLSQQSKSISKTTNIKLYRLYFNNINEANLIISKNPSALFTIEIDPWKVNTLRRSFIINLLNSFNTIISKVKYIFFANEPCNVGVNVLNYSKLPKGLQLIYSVLKSKSKWQHIKVSIPFSGSSLIDTYPVPNSKFIEPLNGGTCLKTNGICNNCVNSASLGLNSNMKKILNLYIKYNYPFSIQIYPFFACAYNKDIPINYCLGTQTIGIYNGMIEAQYNAVRYAMKELIGNNANSIEIIISETGWPSKGNTIATFSNAFIYYKSVLNLMKIPTSFLYKKDIFLFEMYNEDNKAPWDSNNIENNFGLFDINNNDKYNVNNLGLTCNHEDSFKIALKSVHGKYVRILEDGTIFNDATEINDCETITVINKGTYVNLISFWNKGISANLDGTIKADRIILDTWEQWVIIDIENGKKGFKSFHNKYMGAEPDGTMDADANDLLEWEMFEVIYL